MSKSHSIDPSRAGTLSLGLRRIVPLRDTGDVFEKKTTEKDGARALSCNPMNGADEIGDATAELHHVWGHDQIPNAPARRNPTPMPTR